MLVLSRKKNESIIIGDVIEVVVVEIRGDKVRLSVRVPAEISVHRCEVWDAIARENPANSQPIDKLVGPDLVPGRSILVLSRKRNECIVINGNITVVIVDIKVDKVRLGIESPKEVSCRRREVHEALKRMDDKKGAVD
jgi:carbon storage regulator